jgi:tRNA 2-thiocytidine biosynthesis protein TtcA
MPSTASPLPEAIHRKLSRAVGRAVTDFGMLEDGDRVLVAVSGGKDSYTMLHLLRELARKAPVSFTLQAVNIDQGHPGFPAERLTSYMAREGYDFRMVHEDTYSVVQEKIPEGKTFCSLCSRLRRGILYRVAHELGCNVIALGHHRDDILQTLLLNLLFAGQLAAMPPKLAGDDGRLRVIRPLAYCAEEDILAFSEAAQFPILPCDLCGSQTDLQRKIVGEMISDWERKRPGTKTVMLAALRNVRASHLLDRRLWSALGLEVAPEDGAASDGGAAEAEGFVPATRLAEGPSARDGTGVA